ncbi:hypothetical protein SMALB_0071 [Streptomyces malaysiensis]|uniref:Uncharacterized protein n=1 Tax=Streptomyces malaysiensis TaxID=92644 RepID=A0A7X5WW98_STRMQ|nr:hypothetical protein [Streptomyces malaysiensis]
MYDTFHTLTLDISVPMEAEGVVRRRCVGRARQSAQRRRPRDDRAQAAPRSGASALGRGPQGGRGVQPAHPDAAEQVTRPPRSPIPDPTHETTRAGLPMSPTTPLAAHLGRARDARAVILINDQIREFCENPGADHVSPGRRSRKTSQNSRIVRDSPDTLPRRT